MAEHGNSNQNESSHHLYEIIDKVDNDVVKYGISGEELTPDGFSPRAQRQVNAMNTFVKWIRFFARILVTNISGRSKAKEIEEEYIQNYYNANGRNPRRNL